MNYAMSPMVVCAHGVCVAPRARPFRRYCDGHERMWRALTNGNWRRWRKLRLLLDGVA